VYNYSNQENAMDETQTYQFVGPQVGTYTITGLSWKDILEELIFEMEIHDYTIRWNGAAAKTVSILHPSVEHGEILVDTLTYHRVEYDPLSCNACHEWQPEVSRHLGEEKELFYVCGICNDLTDEELLAKISQTPSGAGE
jgi:hypothetical protein